MMPRVERNLEARGGPPRKKEGTGEDPKVGLDLTVRNSTAPSTSGIHSPCVTYCSMTRLSAMDV
jgi:hypothetical protein